jgi:hypothetical protein
VSFDFRVVPRSCYVPDPASRFQPGAFYGAMDAAGALVEVEGAAAPPPQLRKERREKTGRFARPEAPPAPAPQGGGEENKLGSLAGLTLGSA